MEKRLSNDTYILWKWQGERNLSYSLDDSFEIEEFTPTNLKLRKYDYGNILVYIMWRIFTNYKIIYIKSRGKKELAHVNHVLRGFWKFPFMQRWDFIIGPAYTFPQFRRKGLYIISMKYIITDIRKKYPDSKIYIAAHENNLPSNKAIEKVGFSKVGLLRKNKLGIYVFVSKCTSIR